MKRVTSTLTFMLGTLIGAYAAIFSIVYLANFSIILELMSGAEVITVLSAGFAALVAVLIFLASEDKKKNESQIRSMAALKEITFQCVALASIIDEVFIEGNIEVGPEEFRFILLDFLDCDGEQDLAHALSHEWVNLRRASGLISLDAIQIDVTNLPYNEKSERFEDLELALFFVARHNSYLKFIKRHEEDSEIILSECGIGLVDQLGGVSFTEDDRPIAKKKINEASLALSSLHASIIRGAFENLLLLREVLERLESRKDVISGMRRQVDERISQSFGNSLPADLALPIMDFV